MQMRWPGTGRTRADDWSEGQRVVAPQDVHVHVAATCDQVMARLSERFLELGIRVYQSFDLQTALERLPQCGCPHHGEDACTCQYAVWLLYVPRQSPVLMILHGRDGDTWITLSAEDVRRTQVYAIVMQMKGDA